VHIIGQSKLDARAQEGHWMGFDDNSKGHRIFWPEKHTISVECSIIFSDQSAPASDGIPLEGEWNSVNQSATGTSTIDEPLTMTSNSTLLIPIGPPTAPNDPQPDPFDGLDKHVEAALQGCGQRICQPSMYVQQI